MIYLDLVQCIGLEAASLEATTTMLHMCDVNVGTGGPGMVKAVYSAGKPAFFTGLQFLFFVVQIFVMVRRRRMEHKAL